MTITMLRPPSQTKVTQFLRDALAEDSLGVFKLEVMARAAGLLGERHSITHIRVFKRAKKSLGIRRFGLDLELALSGGGNYHDRAKARSKPTQELCENDAVPFQSIGSRGSPVSTLSVRPMTSLGTVGGSS